MRPGPWALRAGLAAAFGLAAGLLWLSNSALVRAAILPHSTACQYNLQTGLPDSVDVLVIGSSRAREAAYPAELAAALGLGNDRVANLAHPSVAPGYDYGVLAALGRTQDLDLVLVEVIARSAALEARERSFDPAPERPVYHLSAGTVRQSYALGTSLGEQARRMARDAPGPALALSDQLTLLATRVNTTISLLKLRRIYPRLFRLSPVIDQDLPLICALEFTTRPDSLPEETRARLQAKIVAARAAFETGTPERWADPAPLGYLSDPARAFDHGTIRDIVALGNRRGFVPVFFYPPGLSVPVSPALPAAFEARFGAPLLVPPAALHRQLSVDGYYDNAHFNAAGRARFVPWLAGELHALGVVPAR